MAEQMIIPDRAISYILFQRTAYLRFPAAFCYRLLTRWLPFQTPLYNIVVAIESRLGVQRIKTFYTADMHREYATIRPALPQTCGAVLDIGCGVAGIDVLIQRHYRDRQIHFYLLDKSHVEKHVFYLFQDQGAFYNSLEVSGAMLTLNGVVPECVHLIEANDRYQIPAGTPIDLALSLLSWGFHYPVATYVRQVHDLLSPHGVAILDVRKGTDGLDVLRRSFRQVDTILSTEKFVRVAARK
jgi:SAM-dependent methyltransferase